jgi:predicted aldo/keto reductase-like oxidoreductase
MQYRKFGNTDVMLSALGFGAMRLPKKETGNKTGLNYDEGIHIIQRAIELGVNYIDTAPSYCNNESEIVVGRAIHGIRDKIYLSTKNPIEDASGEHYRQRLENSLKKLDTDYIDFYHMWGISLESFQRDIDVKDGPLEQAIRAKEEGLIRHISFSFHDAPENLLKLVDTGVFETVLCQYNLLDRSNEAGIEYAKQKGLGVAIMGPVGGGRLGAPSEMIQKLLPQRNVSSAETALRFVISNTNVTCTLSGMSNMQMVEENVRVASNVSQLGENEVEMIKAALEQNKKLAELYCTGCNYCMPCPNEVNIPYNFKLMNYHKVYKLTEFAKQEYQKIGSNPDIKGKKAEECIECGLCEEKCPQKIKIRDQLKETAAVLGK